jgi:bacitracin synthase 3
LQGGPGGALFSKSAPPGRRRHKTYKTGDLARWISDGNIEFLGRIDHQVKIRGFRIELGEIESCLLKRPGIKEAVVIARESGADAYLCAYIVTSGAEEIGDAAELREHLGRALPEYMVPAHFVQLDELPLTANGKLDRKALPEPAITRGDSYTAPRNFVETQLTAIWADILGLQAEVIGIDDSFFQLGGHSLKATVMAARVHKEFQVKLTLAEVFKNVAIRQLAQCIMEKERENYLSLERTPDKEHYAISSAQKRLFVLQQIEPDSVDYNIPFYAIIHGDMDVSRLEQALGRLILRHEILRTSIIMKEHQPVQVIHPGCPAGIEYIEKNIEQTVTGLEFQVIEPMMREFIRPFDLSRPPLLRIRLLKFAPQGYLLMVDIHHIITDGVSTQLFLKELLALYAGEELEPVKFQYRDYSEWQNRLIASGEIKKQEEYWLSQFEGNIPHLELPLDYPRRQEPRAECDAVRFEIPPGLTSQVKTLCEETETTPYMVLLAVYDILLARYCDQDDIVVGSAIAGRKHIDLKNIMGMFVNMLVMRNHPQEDLTFQEFLEQVKTTALNAYENQDYQFDELVHKLGIDFQPGRNPLFDTQFTLQNADELSGDNEPVRFTGFTVSSMSAWQYKQPFDLGLNVREKENVYSMLLGYLTTLFKHSTIEDMARHYVEILEQCLENRTIKLKDIAISLEMAAAKMEMLQEEVTGFSF